MLRFVVRRLLLLIPILFGVSILLFFWIRALPGSPATALLGERATPELDRGDQGALRAQRADLAPVRRRTCRRSSATATSASAWRRTARSPTRSASASPATVELALAAMIFAIVGRHPARLHRGEALRQALDHGSLFALIGISIPIFVLAIILKYIFAVRLGWLPERRPDRRPDRRRAPDELLRPRRDHHARLGDALGRDQAPDPARRSRSARSRSRSSRGSRAPRCSTCRTRTTCARPARRAWRRESSTAGTCCATRCCR